MVKDTLGERWWTPDIRLEAAQWLVANQFYGLIAFNKRVTFWLQHASTALCMHMLLYLRVGSCITITQAHTQTM